MTKKSEDKRIKAKVKKWGKISREFNSGFKHEFKIISNMITNYMMYYKKPTNKTDRILHQIGWWFYMGIIFFAFKGFTYWLTGR